MVPMENNDTLSRRTMVKLGTVGGIALLAGCPDDDDDPDDEEPEDDLEDVDIEEWEEVDEFYFEGVIEHWEGIEPEFIEGIENPPLTLIEGQEYDFRWVNGDGVEHNLEIRDEDDEVINDYVSDDVSEEGEETTLEGVEATEEMDVYICRYHEETQVGDIDVETE